MLIFFNKNEANDYADLINYIVSVITPMLADVRENKEHHPTGNTLEHTISAYRLVEREDINVIIATLLHDIGKSLTPPELQPKHHGHEKKGISLIEDIEIKVKEHFPDKKYSVIDWDFVKNVSKYHMYRNELLRTKHLAKKLLRLVISFHSQEEKLLDYWKVVFADMQSEGYRRMIPVKLYDIIGKSYAICKYYNSKEFEVEIEEMMREKKINIDKELLFWSCEVDLIRKMLLS